MSSIDLIEISLLKYRMKFYANWGKSFRAYGNKTKSLSRWSGKWKSPIFFSDIFIGDWKKFDHWFRLKNWIELNWIELKASQCIYLCEMIADDISDEGHQDTRTPGHQNFARGKAMLSKSMLVSHDARRTPGHQNIGHIDALLEFNRNVG